MSKNVGGGRTLGSRKAQHVRLDAASSAPAGPAEDGLRELRALSKAATPGPWMTGEQKGDLDAIRSVHATGYDDEEHEQTYLVAWCHGDWRAEEDAALIAAARNALPLLLDVAEAAGRYVKHYGYPVHGIDPALDEIAAAIAALQASQGASDDPTA